MTNTKSTVEEQTKATLDEQTKAARAALDERTKTTLDEWRQNEDDSGQTKAMNEAVKIYLNCFFIVSTGNDFDQIPG